MLYDDLQHERLEWQNAVRRDWMRLKRRPSHVDRCPSPRTNTTLKEAPDDTPEAIPGLSQPLSCRPARGQTTHRLLVLAGQPDHDRSAGRGRLRLDPARRRAL